MLRTLEVTYYAAIHLTRIAYRVSYNEVSHSSISSQDMPNDDFKSSKPNPTVTVRVVFADPFIQNVLYGAMNSSALMTLSCLNEYSAQFHQTLKTELTKAEFVMLASPKMCPSLYWVQLINPYASMVAVGDQVFISPVSTLSCCTVVCPTSRFVIGCITYAVNSSEYVINFTDIWSSGGRMRVL
jgi:hypothetical protein